VKKGQLLTDAVRTTWDPRRTLKKNFAALGLAYDANAAISQYQIDPTLAPEEYEVQADNSEIVELLHVGVMALHVLMHRCPILPQRGKRP
jgi:hypothetical protein